MRLFKNRIEKELDKGKWGIWKWHDIVIGGELYLSRLTLFKCPLFSVKLHWIHKPDPDRDLHDHPWRFWSLILRGGYTEIVNEYPWLDDQYENRQVNWFNYKDSVTSHRISSVKPNTLTLVVTGPKHKSWGFYDKKTQDFTNWKDYEQQGKM